MTKIFVVASTDDLGDRIRNQLRDLNNPVSFLAPSPSALVCLSAEDPMVLVVDIGFSRSEVMCGQIKSHSRTGQIVLLAPAESIDSAAGWVEELADEVVLLPSRPPILKMAVKRALEFIRLEQALASEKAAGSDEQVETERFLAVRQIVEKMSYFIAQVAGGVQGGIKYFNELPYFVSIHSREGEVLATNASSRKYLGRRIGRPSWDVYQGKRGTPESCPVCRTLRTAKVMTTRALVRYKNGARVPVLVHTAPIYNDDGEAVLVLEVFAGTKEIEQMALEIRSTQQRYAHLFDAVPCHVAVLDRRFRITASNRRFIDDFGSHTGANFFDILRPGTFPAYRDPLTQTMRDGTARQGEMVLSDNHGQQYNMMVWTAPITTASGKLIQVLAIFADITELRRLQDNLAALGMMISTVSHDLKGCLTGLDAGLYLIESGFYREKAGRIEEGLDVAKLMADRIRKMVHDILYSARERQLQPETVDVLAFAMDVAANVENRIRGANITFNVDVSPGLGLVEIDTGLVRTALINLLENVMEACIEDPRPKPYQIDFCVRRAGE